MVDVGIAVGDFGGHWGGVAFVAHHAIFDIGGFLFFTVIDQSPSMADQSPFIWPDD